MAFLSTQPYKGTRDFYPDEMRLRRWMFGKLRETALAFGYQEYDGPMLESFELYAAKTGEEIVNQQLYWMMDRGERKLAVRPEMTPTLARMVAGRLHELPKPIRWFSIPNLWRYERPQKGRLREHWQLNVDVLGGDPLFADAEILKVALDLMRGFGGKGKVRVSVNHRGLMDHFFRDVLRLSSEMAHKTVKALDARAKIGEQAYVKWLGEIGVNPDQSDAMEAFFKMSFEQVANAYPCDGADHLRQVFALLESSGYQGSVVFNSTVFRGLDYYTGMVFEIYDTSPENRRAMFGGGRYDNLIGLFGKDQLSGVGFGMGDVTLRDFLETHELIPSFKDAVDVFVTLPSKVLWTKCEEVASAARAAGLSAMTPLGEGGFGVQLKLATKHGARLAVLLGEDELKQGKVAVKILETGEQKTLTLGASLGSELKQLLSRKMPEKRVEKP